MGNMYQLWLYPLSMAVVWLIWLVFVLVLVLVVGLFLFLGLFWRVSVAGVSPQGSTESTEGIVYGVYRGLHDSTCVYKLLLNGLLY